MGFLEERDLSAVPTIPEFFKGKSIFITGGSEISLCGEPSYRQHTLRMLRGGAKHVSVLGFMGKVLIEKLLYSCTELYKIYLLLRSKKGVDPNERLKNMYSLPCFDRLRKERPGVFEKKVSVLSGDVSMPELGLSMEHRELIINEVNIIFHVAASVRFDDPLHISADINMRSVIAIIDIAKNMKNLNALVHVSTAYANTKWDPIEETLHPAYADWRDTLEICDNIDEKTLRYLTPKYICNLPNTYVFTKQLAEHIVYEQRGKLPIVITRPSLVISSLTEPFPGWIENLNGPVGIIVGVGKGILRCIYSKKDFSGDFVPVDGCIKHFIAAAWVRGTKKLEPTDEIEIYNCCSRKRITNRLILDYGKEITQEVPVVNAIWTMHCTMTTSKIVYYFKVFFVHLLTALLVDTVLWISGRKTILMKVQRKIFSSNQLVQKFLLMEWIFKVDNFLKLRSCLKEEDINDFDYDFTNFFTKEHFRDCIWGGKRYLLKDKDEHLPKAIVNMKRIKLMDRIIRYASYGIVFWVIVNSNYAFNLYQKIFY